VRDTLAGRAVADVDLATPDGPEQVVAALRDAGLKSAPTGLKHGTVTAISHHRGFEITTLRRDVVTDGRHAEVAWTDDWQVDAARRDFTMNAMFMARDGAVFDYFGGVGDLRAGRVRFVGDPASRIAEDYLRVLRFFRFQARYGGQPPDRATLDALRAGVPGLAKLSPERVWSELKRILLAPNPAASIRLMAELGVLAAVLPEATDVDALERLVAAEAPADPTLRLAALAPCAGEALADRLRLSTAERSALQDLAGPPPDPALDGADLRRALADTPADILIARSWLAHGAAGAALRARLAATPRPRFTLAGRDALALGVPPGPEVGELIREVREWWLEGGCVATAAECRAELARRISGARLPAPSPTG
jgi:poly(A) polymerase/tRNA nucleotidyltransferase (CCA-adding enzyme)